MKRLLSAKIFVTAIIIASLLSSCTKEDEETVIQNIIENDINTTTTWEAGETYVIRGDINVDNTTLTIQPGTIIRFEAGASLSVGYYGSATLIANGTSDKPIIFTSSLDTPTSGAWEGIFLYANCSSNTSFKYCQIKYAGTDNYAALNIRSASCTFSNNTITNAKKFGINCENEDSYFSEMNSNTISDCGGHALRIADNKLHTIGTGNNFICSDGYGVNTWGATDVTGTITWKKLTVPYYVEGEIDVDATLTIEPGTIFKFYGDGSIWFGYSGTTTITANGTSTNKIVFTSSSSTPSAGAWHGIHFCSFNQQNSSMTYCEIAYAGKTDGQALELRDTKLTFSNNSIHDSNETAILLSGEGSFVEMNNNTINNCGKHIIVMSAKYFHTIGTGNSFTAATDMGIFLNGDNVISAGTWRKQTVPVIIDSEVNVDNTLTIEAGSIFMFGGSGSMYIGSNSPSAALIATGTSTSPIVFTAWSSSPAAGAWQGIHFDSYTTGASTKLEYCQFNYAGKNDNAAVYIDNVDNITIKNCAFNDITGYGYYLDNSTLSGTSTGNTQTNCSSGLNN